MQAYHRLTEDQRIEIYALKKAGLSQSVIAAEIRVHKSTVSRELQRNKGLRGYRPKQAQRLTRMRQAKIPRARISTARWREIEVLIGQDWSPEQASGYLTVNGLPSVSPEWIYQYIYADKRAGGFLHKHLRCQKQRRKRRGSIERRGQIKGRVCISQRPDIVEERTRIGDWEVDTVIGKQGGAVLVTLAERKSRLAVVIKAANKTAKAVTSAITDAMQPLSQQIHTLTYDNGKEFAYHQKIAEVLDAKGFFAHPYRSWERGLNENTNGLLRQYFPKGREIARTSNEDIQRVMERLNNRPRKCLGFKTPNQVFNEGTSDVALEN